MQPLLTWLGHETTRIWSTPSVKMGGLLMGCPVWGPKYTHRFGQYCLSSIASPENLKALGGKTRLVVFTDQESWPHLVNMLGPLEGHGITVQMMPIPRDVMDLTKSHQARYPILGVCQTLMVQMAGRAGQAFHALQPDHTYAKAYYPNLFRISKDCDAIIQNSISADLEKAWKEIEKYRQPDKELTIPDRDLHDIAWRHLHKQMRVYVMNDAKIPEKMPHSHYMLWQGRDSLSIYCCHANPAWLSHEVCRNAPATETRHALATLDTKLPMLLKGARVRMSGPKDGLGYIEVSDAEKPARPAYVDEDEFAAICWRNVGFKERHMPFFRQVCELPIKPKRKFVSAEKIKAQHAQVIDLLYAKRKDVGLAMLQAMYDGSLSFPHSMRL
jgi:hypothetical protein